MSGARSIAAKDIGQQAARGERRGVGPSVARALLTATFVGARGVAMGGGELKVALVGCGKIADGHVEQLGKLGTLARLVGVCDAEPLMAEQLATRFKVARHYHDFDRMLEVERPDVVHVTTPPAAHRALTERAFESGCHVYVEKPVTPSHADTEALVLGARSRGLRLTVGYTYLFDPPARAMRELIASGVIGEPIHIDSVFGYDLGGAYGLAMTRDGDHWAARLPGGLIHNNADHLLNKIAEYIDGDEPRIYATGARRGGGERMPEELRVLICGDSVTANGIFSSAIRPVLHSCRVYGTKDTITVDLHARTVVLAVGQRIPSALGRLLGAFDQAAQYGREGVQNVIRFSRSEFSYFAGLEHLMRLFYESILKGTEPPIADRQILWVSRAIERMNEALMVERGRSPHEEGRRA